MKQPEGNEQPVSSDKDDIAVVVSADSLIGSTFDTRYEILSLLGSGATGTAYKARDILLQRDVAIKIIHKHLLANPETIERFKKEAHLAQLFLDLNEVEESKQCFHLASSNYAKIGQRQRADDCEKRIAELLTEQKQFARALEIYKGILKHEALDESAAHQYAQAEKILTECVEGFTQRYGANCPQLPDYLFELAQSLQMQRKNQAALAPLKRAEAIMRESGRKAEPLYSSISSSLKKLK